MTTLQKKWRIINFDAKSKKKKQKRVATHYSTWTGAHESNTSTKRWHSIDEHEPRSTKIEVIGFWILVNKTSLELAGKSIIQSIVMRARWGRARATKLYSRAQIIISWRGRRKKIDLEQKRQQNVNQQTNLWSVISRPNEKNDQKSRRMNKMGKYIWGAFMNDVTDDEESKLSRKSSFPASFSNKKSIKNTRRHLWIQVMICWGFH